MSDKSKEVPSRSNNHRLSPIKSSTFSMMSEARKTPGYSLFDWLHGYVYARWPYLYIGIGVGEHPLAKRWGPTVGRIIGMKNRLRLKPPENWKNGKLAFADTYHGKVMPLESVKQLVMIQEDIRLPDLEQVIPYAQARAIILKNPDHIIALQCPCRSSRQDPCLPLDVCLIVGEPFASFVAEHHPQKSRWITPAEAQDILQAEDERGHVHHAFFKDAMLGRFYAICNCCACCCGAMQAHRGGTPMLASSGYVARTDPDLCIACGDCAEACQFGAITVNDYNSTVDASLCMGCGICVNKCAQRALALERDSRKGEPLEIATLIAAAGALR